jgi:hypothetical protein
MAAELNAAAVHPVSPFIIVRSFPRAAITFPNMPRIGSGVFGSSDASTVARK